MIKELKLENWKSHRSSNLEFLPGVNVIVGRMGAGKTSIVQSVTFALFGTLPEIKSRELKVPELVTRGESLANVELLFENQGKEYKVIRKVDAKGSGDAAIRSSDNLLAGPAPMSVSDYIKDLLKIDEDIFLRTIYAQQNEIDLFLRMGPGERKKRIDELMKLDKFEEARKNCTKLTNKFKIRSEENKRFIEGIDVESLNKNLNLIGQEVNELVNQKQTLSTEIEKAKSEENELNQKLKQLRQEKEELNKKEERLNLTKNQIIEIKEKLKDKKLEKNKEQILQKIENIKNQINQEKEKRYSIQKELEEKNNKKLEIEKNVAILEEKKSESLKKREELKEIEEELSKIKDPEFDLNIINKKIDDIKSSIGESRGELSSVERHLEQLRGAVGTCPVCDTELTPEIKNKLISEKENNIINIKSKLEELNKSLENYENEKEVLTAHVEHKKELENKLNEIKKLIEEIDLTKLYQLNKEKSEYLEIISKFKAELENSEAQIDIFNNEYNSLSNLIPFYEAKEKLIELESSLSILETEIRANKFDSSLLENIENQYSSALRKSQELLTKKESINTLIIEKEKRFLELKERKEKLASIRIEIDKLIKNIEFLTKFSNALTKTQETLRIDLILAVNEVMSTMWNELYPYEYWSGIRLLASENDYTLQMQGNDDKWVSVAGFASGGERMLATLAMRIAFAKVLAPELSLLILDEPTHNLDQRAIETFVNVVQEKLPEFLDQIFIITHDEKLAESGNIIRIT